MAKKYNPLEPVVSKRTYVIIGIIIVLIIGLTIILAPSNKTKIYNEYKLYASEEFTKDHPFYEITYRNGLFKKGLKSVLNNEEPVLVFISQQECQHCVIHIGPFQEYFYQTEANLKFDKIYYFNAQNSGKDFLKFQTSVDGVREDVPQLLLIVNGKVVKRFTFNEETSIQALNRKVKDFYIDVLDIIK